MMNIVWFFWLFICFVLTSGKEVVSDGNNPELDEKKTFKAELFPTNRSCGGHTRMPRTLFKKIHSGASFLAGLKLGAILSKKGFELGHGKIASTHSFQIFGKSVNSAMSLSYGNGNSLLPIVDDTTESDDPSKRTALKKEDKKVFRVTVIENPSNETVEKLQALPLIENEIEKEKTEVGQSSESDESKENVVMLYQDSVEEEPEPGVKSDFLQEHNKRVKEFNEGMMRRRNSKF